MGIIPKIEPLNLGPDFKHENYFSWFVYGIVFLFIIMAIVYFIATQVLHLNIHFGF